MYFICIINNVGFSKHISSINSRITVIPMEDFKMEFISKEVQYVGVDQLSGREV